MKQVFMLSLFLSASAFAGPWNAENNPTRFDDKYEYRFNALPLAATLPHHKAPWTGSYWPRKKGSINYRWNTPKPIGYKLNSPSYAVVRGMSRDQLATLSPAEKLDLAEGNYKYPFSKEVEKGSSPRAKDFEGLCDGWSIAAIQYTEPAPVDFVNPDGIVIPFGSSDIKALISYDFSLNLESEDLENVFVGSYCGFPGGMAMGLASCEDLNPGAFHVIVANQIGLKQESFVVDADPERETWNQPVYGYEFEVRGETRVRAASKGIIIHAKFTYVEDDLDPHEYNKIFNWNPVLGTEEQHVAVMELDYVLELDYYGRIIGGEWLGKSKTHHPDLFWKPTKKVKFTSDFKLLNKLYKPSF